MQDGLITQIVIVTIILLCLFYIYLKPTQTSHYEEIRKAKVNESISWLYQTVNNVCYQTNFSPIYTLNETAQITYTEKNKDIRNKGEIYLVVWDEDHGRTFNKNTLIYAVLHEVAHILSPNPNHNHPFDLIEASLLNKAIELGYYDATIPMESNYATMDLNLFDNQKCRYFQIIDQIYLI